MRIKSGVGASVAHSAGGSIGPASVMHHVQRMASCAVQYRHYLGINSRSGFSTSAVQISQADFHPWNGTTETVILVTDTIVRGSGIMFRQLRSERHTDNGSFGRARTLHYDAKCGRDLPLGPPVDHRPTTG